MLAYRGATGKAKKLVKRVILLTLILLSSVIGTGCVSTEESPAQNSIVYGLTLEPSGFDPHIHQSSELGIVLRQVYDTLVYRHPETREVVPGLADSWTISDDGRVYTFNLRQDVTFHDGTAFNAQAVGANLDRIVSPDISSQRAAFMLGPYQSYEIVDTFTIRIVLSEPYAPLLDSLSQVYLGMASPAAFNEYSPGRYQFHQVGTGPFTFESFVPGDRIVLRRNPAYNWGPEFYQMPESNPVDEIIYRFYTDPATRALALESGEAQIMGEIAPSDASVLSTGGTVDLLPTTIPGMPMQFMFNTQRAPTDNLAVRQALLYATNRGLIVDTVFRGFSRVGWGPVTSETLYYTREVEGRYAFDIAQAATLLETAGYRDTNGDGLLDDGTSPLEIVLIVPPWGFIPEIAQLIQSQWRELGITAVLRQVAGFGALREAAAEGDYHLIAFDTAGYDPSILNQFYLSDGANNFTNYTNSELDAALLQAMREQAPNTRRTLYTRIQQFIMDQALILPIREYVNLNAALPGIDGLRYDQYGWFPLIHDVSYERD